jgi:hypothetical protein
MVLWILVCLIVVPALGGFYVLRGKVATLAKLEARTNADIRNRLTSISRDVGGSLLDGNTLDTPKGKLVLTASKARSYVMTSPSSGQDGTEGR